QAQDGLAFVSLIGLSVPSRAAGNWAAGTAYESIVATFVPNWYPCAWGLGIEASVFAGNELCLSPSGSKMRFWNASEADIPVSFSMTMPSRTMLVLLYS